GGRTGARSRGGERQGGSGAGRRQQAPAARTTRARPPSDAADAVTAPPGRRRDAVVPSVDARRLVGAGVEVVCISMTTVHHPAPDGASELFAGTAAVLRTGQGPAALRGRPGPEGLPTRGGAVLSSRCGR